MASVRCGSRRGSSRSVSADDTVRVIQPPDLRQVTVLRKAEWQRIQDEWNQVNREEERLKEASREREALRLKSQEVVKLWSNTINGQRQKKLEAKKIREEIEEEKRKQIDLEEAEYQEQQRREAVKRAQTQLYYQTDRVKGLHRALLLTEVLKEREAQIELKQRIKSTSKDLDKGVLQVAKTRDEEASRREEERAKQRALERKAITEELKNQMKGHEEMKEREKLQNKKDGEDIQRQQELYQWEQTMESERQENQKRDLMRDHLEHITNRELLRVSERQKLEAEEEQRKLFLSAKQKMKKLRNDREKEIFTEAQARRERILKELMVTQQQQAVSEEQRMAQAIAEREAREALLQQEEEERRAAMLESIAAHRELVRQEKEQNAKAAKQKKREELEAKKEADRIFSEKQQLKAEKIREEERKLKDFNASRMAEKSAREQQLKVEDQQLEAKKAELTAQEENQFQQYSRKVISAASEAQRNVFPLSKAAREGFGGGLGPVFSGVRPSYLVQDRSGAQMPSYSSGTTEDVKKLYEAVDIEEAKRRLGFTW